MSGTDSLRDMVWVGCGGLVQTALETWCGLGVEVLVNVWYRQP